MNNRLAARSRWGIKRRKTIQNINIIIVLRKKRDEYSVFGLLCDELGRYIGIERQRRKQKKKG